MPQALVTGGEGQLGRAVARAWRRVGTIALGSRRLDVTDPQAVAEVLDAHRPDAVVHAAARTDVDRCELDPEGALRVNGHGAGIVAEACARRRLPLILVSTDYVFRGDTGRPYVEEDAPDPVNAYGRTKLAGERAARAAGGPLYVVRTSWLYSRDSRNFPPFLVRAVLANRPVRAAADQTGTPTYAPDLARALEGFCLQRPPEGVYHLAGLEPASWYGFACRVVAGLRARWGRSIAVEPVAAAQIGRGTPRPAYSALDSSKARAVGLAVRGFGDALEDFLDEWGECFAGGSSAP